MINYDYFTEGRMEELDQMVENFTETGCKTVEEMLLAYIEEHLDIDPFIPDMTVIFTDEYAHELVMILNQGGISYANAIDENFPILSARSVCRWRRKYRLGMIAISVNGSHDEVRPLPAMKNWTT